MISTFYGADFQGCLDVVVDLFEDNLFLLGAAAIACGVFQVGVTRYAREFAIFRVRHHQFQVT